MTAPLPIVISSTLFTKLSVSCLIERVCSPSNLARIACVVLEKHRGRSDVFQEQQNVPAHLGYPVFAILDLIAHHELHRLSGLYRSPFIAEMMDVDSCQADVLDCAI